MRLVNELQLKYLCDKYNIKYKIFEATDTIILHTGLDDWIIKYMPGRNRPYCLMHKNKVRQTNKFHVQRWLGSISNVIDCVASHKRVLKSIFDSPSNTYNINSKYL